MTLLRPKQAHFAQGATIRGKSASIMYYTTYYINIVLYVLCIVTPCVPTAAKPKTAPVCARLDLTSESRDETYIYIYICLNIPGFAHRTALGFVEMWRLGSPVGPATIRLRARVRATRCVQWRCSYT